MSLIAAVNYLEAECLALKGFLSSLSPSDWTRRTDFFDWTVADQVMHLHLVDGFGSVSLQNPDDFFDLVQDVRADQARGIELSRRMRDLYGRLTPKGLVDAWTEGWQRLCADLARSDEGARMPWFGPPMGVTSFAAARQMEVWAHGQDIYDLMRVRRCNFDRIRAICDLGVRTQGWSFRNRGLERPDPPQVRLVAPSGEAWVWNESARESIAGPAEDFALVVTQRRNVADTALQVSGAGAASWMEIAQCFAGAPETGPAPGRRAIIYD